MLQGLSDADPNAISKYSTYMLANTGNSGDHIAKYFLSVYVRPE